MIFLTNEKEIILYTKYVYTMYEYDMYYTLYTIRTKFIGKRRKCYLMVEKFEFSSESESESGRKVCKYIVYGMDGC